MDENVVTTAPRLLQKLWEKKFFAIGRNLESVVKEMDRHGYHFSVSTVSHALDNSKFLTKMGKSGAYTFIQKYPHAINTVQKTTKGKNAKKK